MPVINTNLPSLTAQKNSNKSTSSLSSAIERLSSGYRINGAKDDAAGQAIANRLTASIRGLNQAARNSNDGISMLRTAEGVLDEINNRLQRVRELTVQGLNDTYAGDTGDSIQAEINLNLKEIDRLNLWASFNGIPLLNGSGGTKAIQVGAYDHDTMDVDFGPPGFSVQEMGLLDMTVQGAPGIVTPVSSLSGASSQINLDDTTYTTTVYVPPDNNPNLVRSSRGGNLVQLDGVDGRLMNVSISASHDTDTRLNNVRLGVSSGIVGNTASEFISSARYRDSNDNALFLSQPGIVSSGGKYWIQYQSNSGTYYYEAELTIYGDQSSVTAQAKSTTRIAKDDMTSSISDVLRYAPSISKASADYNLTLDGSDETSNVNMELVHLGGAYYVEEKISAGQYAYYRADVTINTGGVQNSITVTSDRSQVISVSDQPYVGGSSVAHLEPENNNVQVNYVDLAGRSYTDVMRADKDGNYVFHLDEFVGGEGAYKTAKVVRNQNNQYMLQTVNGAAEVVLYYPLYYPNAAGTGYTSSYSVSTDVENNKTILTLREADVAQRLRNPSDPLAVIDQAIARVDVKRGEFGVLENRLQSVVQNNTQTSMNLTVSRSRIEDTDFAQEVSVLTKQQILQQASASILAQANQIPQTVLTLLQR
ncbi:flagellin [Pectobacterium atrosepticum]|uniref:flagellin N-terminal helical domain-containing protein n=1 Tax=Pectobacterium atrosepticum TaxID=29471 RepID=UPI0003A423E0|nr:flagellin [Pectobacterium atrosepticum]